MRWWDNCAVRCGIFVLCDGGMYVLKDVWIFLLWNGGMNVYLHCEIMEFMNLCSFR